MKKVLAILGLLFGLLLAATAINSLARGLFAFLKGGGTYEIAYGVTGMVVAALIGWLLYFLIRWCLQVLRR